MSQVERLRGELQAVKESQGRYQKPSIAVVGLNLKNRRFSLTDTHASPSTSISTSISTSTLKLT